MYLDFPPDSIVVQKYGGTSVGTVERIQRVAERVAQQSREGKNRIAVVVSAMAGETNRLVALMREVNPAASARAYDLTVAAGEQISVGLMCAALEKAGVPAQPFLAYQLGIFTDPDHARARIQKIDGDKIHRAWAEGKVPVVAGFQGVSQDLSLTTLGRGGSDTSAVALAVALKAAFCEINTDVSGVYTADPRIVPDAKLIEKLNYDTSLELALLGGKVLHVRCVELAAKYKMPLVVRSTFDAENARRTKIMPFTEQELLEAPVVSGVTLEKNIAKVTVRGLSDAIDSIPALFTKIADAGVNVDIIVHDRSSEGVMSVGFTVSENDLETVNRILGSSAVETRAGLSKVSAVGLGMQTHSGVASKLFQALGRGGVEILMISTSEIKVSCVVPGDHGENASRLLHAAFF